MKKIVLALLSGLLLAGGWPTYGFPLLLFFGFIPLLWIEYQLRLTPSNKPKKIQVFAYAYLSFFIFNIITTSWLYFSTPFGMWFAVLVNTLLMSLVFLIYHIIAKKVNFFIGSLFLITLWISFEKLHLIWDFSWPWLNLGNGFSEYFSWIQWYEYTGTFGGSLWVWAVNFTLFKSFLLFQKYKEKNILIRGAVKGGLLILIPIGISLSIYYTYTPSSTGKINALVLQPNINPYTEKYNTTDKRIGKLLNSLSKKYATDSTQIIIAPETVFADGTNLNNLLNSTAIQSSRELLQEFPHTNFLTGISLYKPIRNPAEITYQSNFLREGFWFNDYNSAFLWNNSQAPQLYHKSKLVVGVETFPYKEILQPILGDVMLDMGGTVAMKTTQPKREVFLLNNNKKVAPIICYESVYGQYVGNYVKNGAQFLAIITNDAWWNNTQGHKQHLSYARLRAIETRKSIARSANTGISAFINEKGEILNQLGYEKQGAIQAQISLNNKLTFYSKYGDYIARISLFLSLFIFLYALTRRRVTN
ncbi:MAG: apolipoprotein N-acyltransferase [Mesonia hippocampi]|uniref:apolipoprotein N-acyltransferase n=1 Tax=Mesonia hippocampi TaxID=1628250 RepID=UPI003F9E4A16